MEDVSSRSYIRAFKNLLTRKTVEKDAKEQTNFQFKEPLDIAAAKNIAIKQTKFQCSQKKCYLKWVKLQKKLKDKLL